jgi:hypothetical protein
LLEDRREVTVLRDTLSAHLAAAEALAIEVAEQKEEMAEQMKHAAEETAEQMKEMAEQMETARLKLEGTQSELRNMYELYERMKASTSWRVTRPLRRVTALKGGGGTGSAD